MADLTVTPVATGIKPVQGMSLGEMMNMARGAQQYRQAEQVNPLLLQQEQEATQQAQVKTQKDILGLNQDRFQKIANSQISMINDPLIIAAEQNPTAVDKKRLADLVMQRGLQTGKALGVPEDQARQLLTPYLEMAEQNPAGLRNFYKQRLIQGMDTASQASTLGGVGASTQPVAPVAPAGGAPAAAGAQVAPGMRVPYPVRSAAHPYIPEPTEAKDQATGEAYRNSLVGRQAMLSTDRRNVEETINQAQKIANEMVFKKGGLAGDVERKLRTAVASEDYKMLAKDLANLQISNLRALGQGGNTVAGMDLTRVASGDETVPPETLIKIARRAQADMTNIDMQATGAEAFKNRFGDNNMNAFKQAWNANADSKIFEAMNIIRDVEDPAEKQKRLKELFPTATKHQEFLTKYRNIKKLSETGSL